MELVGRDKPCPYGSIDGDCRSNAIGRLLPTAYDPEDVSTMIRGQWWGAVDCPPLEAARQNTPDAWT